MELCTVQLYRIEWSLWSWAGLQLQYSYRFGSPIRHVILPCNDDVSSWLFGMCNVSLFIWIPYNTYGDVFLNIYVIYVLRLLRWFLRKREWLNLNLNWHLPNRLFPPNFSNFGILMDRKFAIFRRIIGGRGTRLPISRWAPPPPPPPALTQNVDWVYIWGVLFKCNLIGVTMKYKCKCKLYNESMPESGKTLLQE